MELQYGLIKKAYDLIGKIGQDFQIKDKQGQKRWLRYKKTPQYSELNALLSNDFQLVGMYSNIYLGC